MPAALYALLCLIWGSTWLGIKIGLVGVPPFLGAGLRFLLSTLIVGLVLAVRGRPAHRDDTICVLSSVCRVLARLRRRHWAETKIRAGSRRSCFPRCR
jgi:drug/metabolite transporter (DMT)-like permease